MRRPSNAEVKYRISVIFAILVAGASVLGCSFDSEGPGISMQVREWYPDAQIRIPIDIYGDVSSFVDYVYEHNDGNGWTQIEAGTIRIPNHDGLLEFIAVPAVETHRITATVLGRPAPGQALEPAATRTSYFSLDGVAPSVDPTSLFLTPYQSGVPVPGPPYTFDKWQQLEVQVDHVEFFAPAGSPVTIYATDRGGPPTQDGGVWDSGTSITIWGGDGSPQYHELRFMVVDRAGNKSSIRTEVYSAP